MNPSVRFIYINILRDGGFGLELIKLHSSEVSDLWANLTILKGKNEQKYRFKK